MGERERRVRTGWSGVLTVPNLISLGRLACIPWFVWILFEAGNRTDAALLLDLRRGRRQVRVIQFYVNDVAHSALFQKQDRSTVRLQHRQCNLLGVFSRQNLT